LGLNEQSARQILGVLLFLNSPVMVTEPGLPISGELAALTACGGAIGTAR
jgi:hypothetical protein